MRYRNIYFIGIGGIGMSAIARYFKFKGFGVGGYDRTPSELTEALQKEGIDVHYEDRPDLIPSDVENTLVVYTPAIPQDLQELVYVRENGYTLMKSAWGTHPYGLAALPCSFRYPRKNHHQYPSGTYLHCQRGRLFGLLGRDFKELRQQSAYEPLPCCRCGGRRVRPFLPSAHA